MEENKNVNESVQKPSQAINIVGFILAFIIPLVGLILSIIGINKSKQSGVGKGLSIAGIIISAINMVVRLIVIISFLGLSFFFVKNIDTIDTNVSSEKSEETKNSVVLNDRQKAILEEEGLPTDYDSLTLTQKSAIVSIEDMLQYLEKKYEMEFNYYAYVPSGFMDREHLIAIPPESVSNLNVTVYRDYENGKFIYSDDFKTVLAKPVFRETMHNYFAGKMKDGTFKVFTHAISGEISENPDDILKNVSGVVDVALISSEYNESSLRGYAEAFAEWYLKNSVDNPVTLVIMLVPEDLFKQLDETNYENSLNPNTYSARINCSINSDGDVKIY